jgi:hypothetical protein
MANGKTPFAIAIRQFGIRLTPQAADLHAFPIPAFRATIG